MSMTTAGDMQMAGVPVQQATRARAHSVWDQGMREFASLSADNAELKQQNVELSAALDEARATIKRIDRELSDTRRSEARHMRQYTEAITSLINAQNLLSTAVDTARAQQ